MSMKVTTWLYSIYNEREIHAILEALLLYGSFPLTHVVSAALHGVGSGDVSCR
jgi:hypothetical protein